MWGILFCRGKGKMGVIYMIENLVNGKVYVGSTDRTFTRRKIEHITELRGGYHDNKYLQSSWKKYGESSFVFSVIENTDNREHTHEREKYWIDYYVALLGSDNLYNIMPVEKSSYGKSRVFTDEHRSNMSATKKKLYSENPELNERMREIGRKGLESEKRKGLKFSDSARKNMSDGAKRKYANGYVRTNTKLSDATKEKLSKARSKVWEGFVSPDGVVYRDIDNLNEFAKQLGLNVSGLRYLARGKLYTYKGWTTITPKEKPVRHFGPFVSPSGEVYRDITSLTEFCKTHDLLISGMSQLETEKILSYKGWIKLK